MLYITGGKILTMAGRVYENGTIGIQNGKIAEIKEGSIHNAGCNCQKNIINVDGAWVMPGLIEAHCHVGISEEKKGMEGDDCNENVNPITPYLRAIDAINTMDAGFSDAVRAGITSAMIGPGSSNVVGGQFAFLKLFGRCIDDLIVKAPAAMKVAFGENPKVNYSGMGKSPSTRMAIAGMLREELFHAREYLKKKKENRNFEPDFRMEPWEAVFNGEIPLKAHVHRVDDIFTAVRIAKEFGLRMTLDHCSEGHLVADRLAQEGFPAIVGPDLSSRSKIEVQNVAFKTVGILQKAGMLTAITTDHPVSLIQSLPICAGMAVKAGLPMEEGLKAITINPAKICGVAERVGSLEVGKDADIAVFTGNPMEVFTKTLYTIIDGRIVYDAGKDEGEKA
ncbi:MAG: amidohydrolase [Lachnospiraceae bacterium]|nr:amidohydrolase [Lachnospiraceae bacterium]